MKNNSTHKISAILLNCLPGNIMNWVDTQELLLSVAIQIFILKKCSLPRFPKLIKC